MHDLFNTYDKLDLVKIYEQIDLYWKENKIFKQSIKKNTTHPLFIFYEGPPSANGKPGVHHLMGRTLKDIFCRYKTLKGYQVERKAGWDTHGLPIELGVEKELGIKKEDIGKKITISQYNQYCKESVMRYKGLWDELTEKMGYWIDLENPYVTYHSKYMESVWWLLKRLYEKELLYKSYSIQPYSPAAGTGLSSHELNMPGAYKELSDTTIIAQFKAIKKTLPSFLKTIEQEVFFLAWTTTPWTLSSNTALIIGEQIEYVALSTYNPYSLDPICVILAKETINNVLSRNFFLVKEVHELKAFKKEDVKIPYLILSEFKGKELLEVQYEQLLPWALPYKDKEKAFRVISADFVNIKEGTGIVHCAPTFGGDDAIAAAKNNIPPLLVYDENHELSALVDLKGKFIDTLPEDFRGKFVKNQYYSKEQEPSKSVDVEIAILLKKEGKAFKVEKYNHSYPHCWRTDKPILYYPLNAWFIKTTQAKSKMVALNKQINWYPKATGEGRFGHWLENLNDWNLSRSRYWGIPIPIWSTKDNKELIIIGSIKELIEEIQKSIKKGFMQKNPFDGFIIGDMREENYQKIDLHKDVVDQIVLVSKEGKPMYRENDLIDVWFDSGAMPYAQVHYPFENKEVIDERKYFPADFIAEGVDQTRGWFFTLHALSTMLFDSVAYKNVISNGLVLDKDGQKMSKSKGNTIDPFEILNQFGPDVVRWYMVSNAKPWENLRFDPDGIDEVRRKFFGTLYNTYSFFSLYANIDGFTYKETSYDLKKEGSYLDRWILSTLHSLLEKVDDCYAHYDPTRVARSINDFVINDLSNWYVRLSRRRFWKGGYLKDKIIAYQTLYQCLISIAKLISPISPFFSDQLYRDLNEITKKEPFQSVHLSAFPTSDASFIDKELEKSITCIQQITSMVLSLRKKEKIKVRQPLSKLLILCEEKITQGNNSLYKDHLAFMLEQEVNVKEILFLESKEEFNLWEKKIKPNYKTLGPKLGKEAEKLYQIIKEFSLEDIEKIEKEQYYPISMQGGIFSLSLLDVEIIKENKEGWAISLDKGMWIALNKEITPELRKEGIARDLVNRIQNVRKQEGLAITDKITLEINDSLELISLAIKENKDYICEETLALEIIINASKEGFPVYIEDHEIKLSIKKIST